MRIESDFLVIGSGIAGLSFALQAANHGSVAIVTKRDISESATKYAQGGIASVFSAEDSFDAHVEDTLVAGAGICHEDVVRMVVEEGPVDAVTSTTMPASTRWPCSWAAMFRLIWLRARAWHKPGATTRSTSTAAAPANACSAAPSAPA